MNRVLLPTLTPVDLSTTLDSGQCFRWRQLGDCWVNVLDGDVVTLTSHPEGIAIASTAPGDVAVERMMRYLRLDDDLMAIQGRLGRHPHVLAGITAYPGLRLLRQDPWETLAGFILSSTSNIKRISRTMALLARTFGAPAANFLPAKEGGPALSDRSGRDRAPAFPLAPGSLANWSAHAFPSPEALAEAGEVRLRELGCGFRAPYLARAAQAVARGDLPLHALRGASYDTIHDALTALVGVGDKIADCVMLFALDRSDAFPADRWVRRAVAEWYGVSERTSYADIRAWATGTFGNDAGYANHYLFWQKRQQDRVARS